MNIHAFITDLVQNAMIKAGASHDCEALVKPSTKKQFGDYQVNGIMATVKKLGQNPRTFAEAVLPHLENPAVFDKLEIAGPGFINLFLNKSLIEKQIEQALHQDKLNVSLTNDPKCVVIDYSSPNIAKEMHVGHIRSTIIGDVSARILSFLGHNVIRVNHVGDWGTQFGMLIAYLEKVQNEQTDDLNLSDLEQFYRNAKKCYDEDSEFAERSRNYVVKLQGGDPFCLDLWRKLVDITMQQNMAIYRRLNVTLTMQDTMGESFYNEMLPIIIDDLTQKGIAVKSNGALVVFLDEYKNKDGEPMAIIIQKSDGGFLYATTDIACLKYRYETLKADRILYYTDSRQQQHLEQVYKIARMADYVPETVKAEHHMFGMILGKDGKPFKTRSGDTVKLNDLLDEAIIRAKTLIENKNTELAGDELNNVINAVAIGAVKYADLSKNRNTDYIFDWDNMLTFEGNTAPYLQYAYTRIVSIFRKLDRSINDDFNGDFIIDDEKERALALKLIQLDETLQVIAKDGTPHLLCHYLYDVATLFSSFYEHCSILNANSQRKQLSRLKLAKLAANTLKTGLTLLGIDTVERM